MSGHAKVAVGITLVGLIGLAGWKFAEPMVQDFLQTQASDAGTKGTIAVGLDSWVGYFPLCSPEIRRLLKQEGYGLKCVDDQADYQDRFTKLKSGKYDFAVASVDSFILNGASLSYPGAIVAVIDESKGGDAMIARASVIDSIEALKQRDSVKVAFTENSPSHHLLKAIASHFDVATLRPSSNHLPSDGSGDALSKLKSGEADVAILWEPDVSRALESSEFVRLMGTDDTQELIVDILLASHSNLRGDEEKTRVYLASYFKALKYYREHPDQLSKEIAQHFSIKTAQAEALQLGVEWASLDDNAKRWFGLDARQFSGEALTDTIRSTVGIQLDNGDFSANPIPSQDPYRLMNSRIIDAFYNDPAVSSRMQSNVVTQKARTLFDHIDEAGWQTLVDVGSLKIRNIVFASGTSELTDEGQARIQEMLQDLQHYPNFRVEVRGHSGLRGDPEINQTLSQQRAEQVLSYIRSLRVIDENRFRAIGLGGSRPLQQRSGESNRAYNYRLPRVEIALLREPF
jgi:outer membrane protein OmpA-like peptidoglycan-associated protein/ABC-type amino acid transport substrate-binding protein